MVMVCRHNVQNYANCVFLVYYFLVYCVELTFGGSGRANAADNLSGNGHLHSVGCIYDFKTGFI